MQLFIQYLKPSTGYIAGTIPPQFGEDNYLIAACGSDGVLSLPRTIKRAATIHRLALQNNARNITPFPAYRVMRNAFPRADVPLSKIINL